MDQLTRLKATLAQASQALRVFPLMHNGLVDDATRETARYKKALKAYSQAKIAVLIYNKTMKEGV